MAEEKFKRSKLKSALKYARRALRLRAELEGVSEMATAFKILRCVASQSRRPNYYEILGVEPFAHINSIKKRYKSLALALHPDNNTHAPGSQEAFKHVGEAFRVLSDKLLRKDYDATLRLSMQAQSQPEAFKSSPHLATFWTACSTCRLLHQFERRYVGHRLLCPNCRKGFLAVEEEEEEEEEEMNEPTNDDIKVEGTGLVGNYNPQKGKAHLEVEGIQGVVSNSRIRASVGTKRKRERVRKLVEKNEKDKTEKLKRREMTLAEMQLALRRKLEISKRKSRGNKQKGEPVSCKKVAVAAQHNVGHPICMTVEDSDFYDFDKDRMERSFKKGSIWALYDDDDGMPRHYGLIGEVCSLHPFSVKMSWLDIQRNNGSTGFFYCLGDQLGSVRVSCGSFKAGRMDDINSINMFSHEINFERVAKEIYRIYPRKGSVWALYSGNSCKDGELASSSTLFKKRSYEIVVLLTSYSEMHGLSVAYLEKVEGFKTIFKRREIGIHAITWFEQDNVSSFSHQIPARKVLGDEAPNLPKECWELDPASLPSNMLRMYN